MFSFLKNHPFAVEAFFESSLVLTFAVPKEELITFLPKCLTPDTLHDKWGFVALAMVKTKSLRPKGFPEIMGNDFFLTGYRIFVRYKSGSGKSLRGLYILKSETDKKKMEILGNVFTHYNYTTIDIQQTYSINKTRISSFRSGLTVEVETDNDDFSLPAGSPFDDWKEARQFAGPLPNTFSYDPKKKEVLIIEGIRHNWKPAPIHVIDYNVPFLNDLNLKNIQLANAFIIRNVPYHWQKGRIEKWKG